MYTTHQKRKKCYWVTRNLLSFMNSSHLQPKPTMPWIRSELLLKSLLSVSMTIQSLVCAVSGGLCVVTLLCHEVCWLCRYRKAPHLEGFFSKERAIRTKAQQVVGRMGTEYSTAFLIFINVVISYWTLVTLVLESRIKVYLTAVEKSSLQRLW